MCFFEHGGYAGRQLCVTAGNNNLNVESPAQLTHNFPLIVDDARAKGYFWTFDAKVPGELTR